MINPATTWCIREYGETNYFSVCTRQGYIGVVRTHDGKYWEENFLYTEHLKNKQTVQE
jgi:hypothetical protein